MIQQKFLFLRFLKTNQRIMFYLSKIFFRRCMMMMMLCWGFCVWVQAEKVDPEKAGRIAQRFIDSKQKQITKANVRLKYTATGSRGIRRSTTPNKEDQAYYYVFDAGNGFVIVSADDAVRPVLGYSTNGNYDENNLAPTFRCWMNSLQQEIAEVQKLNLSQSKEVRQEWDKYSSGIVKNDAPVIIGPLLQTKWGQNDPYNKQCPEYRGYRCVAGCVATAMAQIMKYHQHPQQGSGQSEEYTTAIFNIEVPSVNFEVNYNWANMLNSYSGINATAQQQEAVATLMYHCGVSVKMEYGINESGASSALVMKALTEHFGYDESLDLIYRGNNETIWENLIRDQIDMGLPVFYAGYNECSAHAFVCDGYDNTGLFHFNWGWGGVNDGFYVTSTLNPGINLYEGKQEIIYNIKPKNKQVFFDGGSGTQDDPFRISKPAHLANLSKLLQECNTYFSDRYYKLTADLDLSRFNENSENRTGWIPIGKSDCPFKGEFDGNKKTITGLYIDLDVNDVGLFGYMESAKIQNLGIVNANITGRNFAGGIAGRTNDCTITGCYVTGSITSSVMSTSSIGGIAGGINNYSTISYCYSTGTVNGNYYIGGIAGSVQQNSVITNCYSISTVSGRMQIGGIAGSVLPGGRITACAALNPVVNGSSVIGRVASENNGGSFSENIAYCNMGTDNNAGFQGLKTHDGLDGEDRSASNLLQSSTNFPSGFTTPPTLWTFSVNKLPGLFGETVEIPMHLRRNINKDIDMNGAGTITVYPLNLLGNDASDVCSKKFVFVDDNGKDCPSMTYNCNDLDTDKFLSIATIDDKGNRIISGVQITIGDKRPPVFDVVSQVVALTENGNVTIHAIDFARNIRTSCNVACEFFFVGAGSSTLTFSSCNDIGTYDLEIFARNMGNHETSLAQPVKCTIRGQMEPGFDVIYDMDISLKKDGSVTITPKDFIRNDSICIIEGSKDKAIYKFEIDGELVDDKTFLCHEIDEYFYPIVVKIGECGNPRTKYVSFTISDTIPPDARCKYASLVLDEFGNTTLRVEDIDEDSRDNCEILSMQIRRTSDIDGPYTDFLDFELNDLYASKNSSIPVTLRVIDVSDNESFCKTAVRLNPTELGDIPNIFTPNGDGFNDRWEIKGINQYPESIIRIFNRNKKLLMELKGAQMPWDGRDLNGNLLESGYYLYQIELFKNGNVISGFVTILR